MVYNDVFQNSSQTTSGANVYLRGSLRGELSRGHVGGSVTFTSCKGVTRRLFRGPSWNSQDRSFTRVFRCGPSLGSLSGSFTGLLLGVLWQGPLGSPFFESFKGIHLGALVKWFSWGFFRGLHKEVLHGGQGRMTQVTMSCHSASSFGSGHTPTCRTLVW